MKAVLKRAQTGISRFDFAISITIIALLISMLLVVLDRVQFEAEEVAMEADLTNMRWGLRELWAHRNAIGQALPLEEIENVNPVRLLNERPTNYSGEYSETPQGLHSVWYFNTTTKRLVYLFSDGSQKSYRLAGTAGLNRAPRGMMGGIDLVQD